LQRRSKKRIPTWIAVSDSGDDLLLLLAVGFIAICLQQDIRKVTQRLPATICRCEAKKRNCGNHEHFARHCARSYHFVIALWRAKEHNSSRKLLEYHR